MNRIRETFQSCRHRKSNALVGFLTGGDPNLHDSRQILDAACSAGLDMLELGIPSSNPTADGPTIQRSSQRALSSGASTAACLELASFLREKHSNLPIILFGYSDSIFDYGAERFIHDALEREIDGFLCVDLPPERMRELTDFIPQGSPFDPVYLISPTTTEGAKKQILAQASGFIYVQSRPGVTGVQNSFSSEQLDFIQRQTDSVRILTDLPIVVGFGISSAEDIAAIAPFCDGTVVGSAMINIIEKHTTSCNGLIHSSKASDEITQFITSLKYQHCVKTDNIS